MASSFFFSALLLLCGLLLSFSYFITRDTTNGADCKRLHLEGSSRWHTPLTNENEPHLPHLCVLARADPKKPALVPTFLMSLLDDQYPNVDIFLQPMESPYYKSMWTGLVDSFNAFFGSSRPQVHLSPFPADLGSKLYQFAANDWGYRTVDIVLDWLLPKDPLGHPLCRGLSPWPGCAAGRTPCEYMLFTNADNMYTAGFYPMVVPHMQQKKDIIAFDFISHYTWPRNKKNVLIPLSTPVNS